MVVRSGCAISIYQDLSGTRQINSSSQKCKQRRRQRFIRLLQSAMAILLDHKTFVLPLRTQVLYHKSYHQGLCHLDFLRANRSRDDERAGNMPCCAERSSSTVKKALGWHSWIRLTTRARSFRNTTV